MPDWAGVIEIWTYYNVEAIYHSEGPENAHAFRDPKIKKCPSPDSSSFGRGYPSHAHPHTLLSACGAFILAPLALDLPLP